MFRKLVLAAAAAGALALGSLSPATTEAAGVFLAPGSAPVVESDVIRVRRCWHNAWSSRWHCHPHRRYWW
jgi:hypothetical protein